VTLRERVLGAVPVGGVPAKRLYATLAAAAQSIDCALLGLLNDRVLVLTGGVVRRAHELVPKEEEAPPADPGVGPGQQRCKECRQVLGVQRFGLTRKNRPARVCRHCLGKKISAGGKRRYAALRAAQGRAEA
jgi:hypothetical protein